MSPIGRVRMPDWSEVGGKLLTISVPWVSLYNRENSSCSMGLCVLNEIMHTWHQHILAHCRHSRSCIYLFLKMEVYLFHSVVSISAVWQGDSVIQTYTFFVTFFSLTLSLQDVEYGSLGYTLGFYLSILFATVCIC